MASNYFTITPTSGSGDGTIRVAPTGNNMTISDRTAIVSINGQNVTIRQWGIPSIARVGGQEPVSAPATGATYQYKVSTHYQVQFRNKPDWITIDDGQGNYITSAQTIEASVANGHTYNFTILPNTSNDTRETPANFGLWHYLHSTLQTNYDEVSISQAAGAEDYIVITPSSALDWDDTNAKVINIQANVSYTTSNSNTTDFTLNGGNGYVTIRANDTNTGQTLKTTTISVVSTKASFPFTATCVVTQYRRPRISMIGNSTVPNSGGTKYIEVTSDYYWWISPTVYPDTNAYYEYISMSAKTSDANMAPVPSGHTYSLDWTANNGVYQRNGSLYVGYLKLDNSTTARSSQSVMFEQDTMNSDTLVVTPARIPETGYASSGGGVYTLQVTTSRSWGLNNNPTCVVSPISGAGNTTVTVTVPPSTKSGSSYHWIENIVFITTDGGLIADVSVPVWQYDSYTEPRYISVSPSARTISSGGSGSLQNSFEVSANTSWTVGYQPDWVTLRTLPIGGSIVTSGESGFTTIYVVCSSNSGSERSDGVYFTPMGAGVSTTSITITQLGAPVVPSAITLNQYAFTFTSASVAGQVVQVTSPLYSWTAHCIDDWLDAVNAYTGGTGTTSWQFDVAQNYTNSDRTGHIVFSANGDASAATLTIHQSAATVESPYVNVSPAIINSFSSAGTGSSSKFFRVSANTDWLVTQYPNWVDLYSSATGGTKILGGTSGVTLAYPIGEANTGSTTRTGTFTFSGDGTTISADIYQNAAPASYDDIVIEPEDDLTAIPATGGVFSIYVENDGANSVEWEINYDGEIEDWAVIKDGPDPESSDTLYELVAGNQGYVYLNVQPNDGSTRQGTISISPVEGSPQLQSHTLTIRQFGE